MGSAQKIKAASAPVLKGLALWLSMLALGACASLEAPPLAATAPASGCELDGSHGSEAIILPGEAGAPEVATGYTPKSPRYARTYMAVTNNPTSTKLACEVLKRGGSAVDAAIAAQMVLTLVEPQSSGIGGGGFIMHYDAADKTLTAYDGRETAPAAADENYLRWVSPTNKTPPKPNLIHSGRSIGTPGVLRALELAHQEHGRLSWKELFEPAIALARDGFPIPPRMAASIQSREAQERIQRDAEMAAYLLDADGKPRKVNAKIRNPALADTYARIAKEGADAFYKDGSIARAIIAKIQTDYDGQTTPGLTTLADLAQYQARKREALCSDYREYVLCGMPPPSSGGLAVAQTLGILEHFDLARHKPTGMDGNGGKPSAAGVHLVAEANSLAYADRNRYVADPDFVSAPGEFWASLLDKPYLARRARLIEPDKSLTLPTPAGELASSPLATAPGLDEHGTTQLTFVDRYGNVVSMTSSVEAGLGSYHFTNGFVLNNQLSDFNGEPSVDGIPVANRIEPGKRPRSSMAPTLVFKRNADGSRGDFFMATGSPGGAAIIQYVTKTLVGVLDWKMDPQQAVSMIDFGANNATLMIGGEHPNVEAGSNGDNDLLVKALRGLGHTVNVTAQSSGLGAIVRTTMDGKPALVGGADPRREGVVLGDTFKP